MMKLQIPKELDKLNSKSIFPKIKRNPYWLKKNYKRTQRLRLTIINKKFGSLSIFLKRLREVCYNHGSLFCIRKITGIYVKKGTPNRRKLIRKRMSTLRSNISRKQINDFCLKLIRSAHLSASLLKKRENHITKYLDMLRAKLISPDTEYKRRQLQRRIKKEIRDALYKTGRYFNNHYRHNYFAKPDRYSKAVDVTSRNNKVTGFISIHQPFCIKSSSFSADNYSDYSFTYNAKAKKVTCSDEGTFYSIRDDLFGNPMKRPKYHPITSTKDCSHIPTDLPMIASHFLMAIHNIFAKYDLNDSDF